MATANLVLTTIRLVILLSHTTITQATYTSVVGYALAESMSKKKSVPNYFFIILLAKMGSYSLDHLEREP